MCAGALDTRYPTGSLYYHRYRRENRYSTSTGTGSPRAPGVFLPVPGTVSRLPPGVFLPVLYVYRLLRVCPGVPAPPVTLNRLLPVPVTGTVRCRLTSWFAVLLCTRAPMLERP